MIDDFEGSRLVTTITMGLLIAWVIIFLANGYLVIDFLYIRYRRHQGSRNRHILQFYDEDYTTNYAAPAA